VKYLNEENELQPMIIDSLERIEHGLTYCGKQISLNQYGILDILAKDINNNFVVIELKVVNSNSAVIFQTLQYQFAISNNIEEFKRVYGVNGEPEVRMIIVSPSFSPVVFGVLETFIPNVNVKFVEYTENIIQGNRELNFKKVDAHGHYLKPVKIYNQEDIVNVLKKENVRSGFKRALNLLIKEGFEPRYHTGNKVIDFYYRDGKTGEKIEFCRFETMIDSFKCYVPNGDQYDMTEYTKNAVWFNLMRNHIIKAKMCF
jgi:hypothetical protein